MDSPLDNVIDLGLVNFVKHPSNPDFVVFRFADINRANDFEFLLKEQKIWYEKGEEKRKIRTYYLFGIRNKDFEKAQKINFKVETKNRRYIISNNILRWSLLIIVISITVLAAVGYCSRPV